MNSDIYFYNPCEENPMIAQFYVDFCGIILYNIVSKDNKNPSIKFFSKL